MRCLMCNQSSPGIKVINDITVIQLQTGPAIWLCIRDWTLIEESLCWRCTVDQGAMWKLNETKLVLLTWKQDRGTEGRWKFCINFPPALSNFFPLPQNNIQQVFRKLHALLVEEYSGEDLQIIACPSTEQVQLKGKWHILIPFQQPSWNKWSNTVGTDQLCALLQINLLLSVNK